MMSYWEETTAPTLSQGEIVKRCMVPKFEPRITEPPEAQPVNVRFSDVIILTQGCDLANAKAGFAAICHLSSLEKFEDANSSFSRKGAWEQVRKGRVEGLHLLGSPTNPDNNRDALVVDFRQIYSLPIDYLTPHAQSSPPRWRLRSPYLEHFSQAFARFFMRVGLPSAIPPYK